MAGESFREKATDLASGAKDRVAGMKRDHREAQDLIISRGKWALVTGASGGIGLCIAQRLAERGMNIVAVARNEDRLEDFAFHSPSKTEVLPADLSKASGRKAVVARCKAEDNPVELLINNAGIWQFVSFGEMTQKDMHQMMDVNVTAVVELSRAAVPGMVKRGHGGIVNISSIAGFLPLPYEAVYGGTKAFVTSFSQGLYEELKDTGVLVSAIAPGLVRTELHARTGGQEHVQGMPDRAWMSAEAVAEIVLRAIDKRDPLCVPGGMNKALSALLDVVPTPMVRWTAAKVNRQRIPHD